MIRRWSLVPFAAVAECSTALAMLLALLVVAAPLRGQAGAPQDEVRYRDPDGTIKTISRAEHQSRVADLRRLIDDLESNRMVLMTASGDTIPVSNQRLHDIARWLAKQDPKKGGLTALQVPGWINGQLEKSREMIPTLDEQLKGLTTINPENPAGSTMVEWPVPMDWQKVKGTLNVTHRSTCQYSGRRLPLEEPAHFTLQGDAKVALVFEAGDRAGIPGTIIPDGSATGFGRRTLRLDPPLEGGFRWTAVFNRMNDDLVMTRHFVAFTPNNPWADCDFSELIPEMRAPTDDPYADQFPNPMSWARTKGELQGDFFVLCNEKVHAESGLATYDPPIEGAFRVRLDGYGTVYAEIEHESPRHQVQANARIEDRDGRGRAILTGTGPLGQYHWDLRLVRDGDRIDLDRDADSGLRFVPVNSAIPCNEPTMLNVK